MKKYLPTYEDNEGTAISGLYIIVGGKVKTLCYKTYIVKYLNDMTLQQLLYQDMRIRRDLGDAAKEEWAEYTHAMIRLSVMRIFNTSYRQEVYEVNSPRKGLVNFSEARQHMSRHVQVVAEWCMYEYSHYPLEWGVAPPPVDVTQYIPDDLWAKDITKGARKIGRKLAAGEEMNLERVRKNEYDYTTKIQATSISVPEIKAITTGKKTASLNPRLLRKLEAEKLERERQEQQRIQEEADNQELAELDRELDKRLALIDEYATDLTLDDEAGNDLVIELPLTAAEISAVSLRGKEKERDTSHEQRQQQFKPIRTATTREAARKESQANIQ